MPVTDTQPISQLPWQVSSEEFMRAAAEISEGGACCMFVIDSSIPTSARSGYAALVIAYARADEPVCILEGGAAALLVRSGGVASAETVARRVFAQMRRLSLDSTLRAGVVALGQDPAATLSAARAAAEAAPAGEVHTSA
ncbi:MAG: hypothetical protein E6J45_00280 [Chloroflexi bacterium]|nr:MAG: hypothetical protein E6J45_00280 [Chloroflexota bacterium]